MQFIEKTMETRRVELTTEGKSLPERHIPGRWTITITIFDSHDATQIHSQEMHCRIQLSESQEKINHLMYMDVIKLFTKKEKELETLIQTVRIYRQDVGMEFGIEKCAMLVIKGGKRHDRRNRTANSRKIRTHGEKETYRYLGILETDTIKQMEMKEKI